MPTTNPTSNKPSFEDLCAKAEACGADKGAGNEAQIKYAMEVVFEPAYLGVLDLSPNKHGAGKRDGIVLAERYVKGRTGVKVFDTKTDSARKLISCTDTLIKLGSCPKWGQGQPLAVVNEFLSFRKSEGKAGKKVQDAFNAFLSMARAQLKSAAVLTKDEYKQFVYKSEPEETSVEDVLQAIRKKAIQLKDGKLARCPDMDTSNEVHQIISACTKRLTAIAKSKKDDVVAEVKATIQPVAGLTPAL